MIHLPSDLEMFEICMSDSVKKAALSEKYLSLNTGENNHRKTVFVKPFIENGEVAGIDVFYFESEKDFQKQILNI